MFDPVSWGLGFSATKIGNILLDKVYSKQLVHELHDVACNWARVLPPEISTSADAIFDNPLDSSIGESHAKLQQVLFCREEVPEAEVWLDALLENWRQRKESLGSDANGFFVQSEKSARLQLSVLAESLTQACKKDEGIFRISTLAKMDTLGRQGGEIFNDLHATRSEVLMKLDNIEQLITRSSYVDQDLIFSIELKVPTWLELCALNSIVCVDEPSSVIAGKKRQGDCWIAGEGQPIEKARFVPVAASKLGQRLRNLFDHWGDTPTGFDSDDPQEQLNAVARFHHDLLSIHPFEDGNGRLARVVSDIHMSSIFGKNRRANLKNQAGYYDALGNADYGEFGSLFDLFDRCLIE